MGSLTKLFRLTVVLFLIVCIFIGYEHYLEKQQLQSTEENIYIPAETTSQIQKRENPYAIFVDVEESKLYLLKNGELEKVYPCAGGKYTTPSPIGTWTIVSKGKWGEGFGGSWLGFNVPWGKFGIHGTIYPNSIGWCSSKGCIRMFNKDVAELYRLIPHGTKVTIVDGPYGPFGRGIRGLDPGEYGADVKKVQKRLQELGYYHGPVDGKYGEGMKAAVHKYQKDNNLPINNQIGRKMIEMLGFFEFE